MNPTILGLQAQGFLIRLPQATRPPIGPRTGPNQNQTNPNTPPEPLKLKTPKLSPERKSVKEAKNSQARLLAQFAPVGKLPEARIGRRRSKEARIPVLV